MMLAAYILLALAATSIGWRFWHRVQYFLHMAQLHGYKVGEYSDWLISRGRQHIFRPAHAAAIVALGIGFMLATVTSVSVVGFVACALWFVIFASAAGYLNLETKKPFSWTARAKRLMLLTVLVCVTVFLLTAIPLSLSSDKGLLRMLAGLALLDFSLPVAVLLACFLALPIERSIQNGFKRQARRKLAAMPHLQIVAITGSYGKTSIKFAIAEILKQRFNVLATPGSFNTPMGICLVINRDLKPEHQVLILEMGARYAGDIQELCDIAQPNIGIVTNVGIAHLETFGSQANIAKEKGVLIENVRPDGVAILNGDDELVRKMQSRANSKVLFAGLESKDSELRVDIPEYSASGATFDLTDLNGETISVSTRLVGKHNIHNIVTAAVVGQHLGLRLRQIAHAASRLEPVQHRLEVKQIGDITVIDDAFNSNPVGARNAVEILGQFPGTRRIIVTPGMIELGDQHYNENREFGKAIASSADLAILVGKQQTQPIFDGLQEADYPSDQIKVVGSLSEAQEFLASIRSSGDVILYENDLPDQFDENE